MQNIDNPAASSPPGFPHGQHQLGTFPSVYDFGYLVKLLTGAKLPETEREFLEPFNRYFSIVYDVKYLKNCWKIKGGLEEGADTLKVAREEQIPQAGSDSLITERVLFKIQQLYPENNVIKRYWNTPLSLKGGDQLTAIPSGNSAAQASLKILLLKRYMRFHATKCLFFKN